MYHHKNDGINDAQRIASDPKYSIYVNASAGSGKTKVLIDRVLRLVLAGNKLSNILCLTFTNSAAKEMMERLRIQAKHWHVISDTELLNTLRALENKDVTADMIKIARGLYHELLLTSQQLKIQTVHSFCAKILKIDIDNNTATSNKIISNAEKYFLLKKAFHESIEDENLKEINEKLTLAYSTNTLFDHIQILMSKWGKLYLYFQKNHNTEEIRNTISQFFGIPIDLSIDDILADAFHSIEDNHTLKEIGQALSQAGYQNGIRILSWLNAETQNKFNSFVDYANIFLTLDMEKRKRIDGIKSLDLFYQQELITHQQQIFDLVDLQKTYIAASHNIDFLQFAHKTFAYYEKLKSAKNLIEYDQLLLDTIQLLENSHNKHSILWELDCIIDHILVDEAQDLNEYQWTIIKLLSDEFFAGIGAKNIDRTIFIVGDNKQSIFSFQGAKPEIFQEIGEYYKLKADHALKPFATIDFDKSFRSGNEIISLLNKVFHNTKASLEHNMLYREHVSYRQTQANCDIWHHTAEQLIKDDKNWLIPEKKLRVSYVDNPNNTTVPYLIITQISNWIQNKRHIYGTNDIFQLSDLMIIFRKRGTIYNELCNILKELKIQFIPCGSIYLTDQNDIIQLISLLKFIINPEDDLNCSHLLQSKIFKFSEYDIFELAYKRERTLFDSLSFNEKYKDAYNILCKLRNEFWQYTLYEFCYKICSKHYRINGKFDIVIENFLETAAHFSHKNPFAGPNEFVKWLQAEKVEVVYPDNMNANAIKLATVHSAKGLESKIVILADAFESENLAHDSILWVSDNLIVNNGNQHDNLLIKKIKEQRKIYQKHENFRLLYVAMTRSRDELYIVGSEKGRAGNWYELVAQHI